MLYAYNKKHSLYIHRRNRDDEYDVIDQGEASLWSWRPQGIKHHAIRIENGMRHVNMH